MYINYYYIYTSLYIFYYISFIFINSLCDYTFFAVHMGFFVNRWILFLLRTVKFLCPFFYRIVFFLFICRTLKINCEYEMFVRYVSLFLFSRLPFNFVSSVSCLLVLFKQKVLSLESNLSKCLLCLQLLVSYIWNIYMFYIGKEVPVKVFILL